MTEVIENECIISIKSEEHSKLEKSADNDTSELADESSFNNNRNDTSVEARFESQSEPGSVKRSENFKEAGDSTGALNEQEIADPIDLYRKLEIIKEIK